MFMYGCVCVCAPMCVCVCVHVWVCVFMFIHVCMGVCVPMYGGVCTCMSVGVCVFMSLCVFMSVWVSVCVHVCGCVHVCMGVCVCSCLGVWVCVFMSVWLCVFMSVWGCVCVCVCMCACPSQGRAGKNWRGRGWSLHLRVNEAPLPREGGSWPGLLCGLESWSLSLTRAGQSGWEGYHTGLSESLAVCDVSGRSVGQGAGQGLELPACWDLSQPLPLVSLLP